MVAVKPLVIIGACIAITAVVVYSSQNRPIPFKRISFAIYTENSSEDSIKDVPTLRFYATIDSAGLVKMADFDQQHDSVDCYSYKMNNADWLPMEEVFDEKKKLNQFLEKRQIDTTGGYDGRYDYLEIEYENGIKDSLSFIVPSMSDKFDEALSALTDIFLGNRKLPFREKIFISPQFITRLSDSYKKSVYLPHIKEPPPAK